MTEEFGKDYKDNQVWTDAVGIQGLAKLPNPFASRRARNEFRKLDVNKDKSLSKNELSVYIASHSDLWKMLEDKWNVSVQECIQIATNVAFQLAIGEGLSQRELTEAEFTQFHKKYVLDDQGSREFFLRTLFGAFDTNGDGVLQREELDHFLDIFYEAKVFRGKSELPPKEELEGIVMGRLDKNRDGVLSFDEVRDLLQVAAVVAQ